MYGKARKERRGRGRGKTNLARTTVLLVADQTRIKRNAKEPAKE